jgi:hypothetical protein
LATVHGCDSIITLALNVWPEKRDTLEADICLGESYQQYGFNILATEAGVLTQTQHLQTSFGCDSTVTLVLTVKPTSVVSISDEICVGEPYSGHGFDTIVSTAGIYTLSHQDVNVSGCDSTTILTLTVKPNYNISISSMICSLGSYLFNGRTLTEAGTYTDTLTTISGCDSIVSLTLTVGDVYLDTITAHICLGESYNAYNFSVNEPTESGFYEQHLTAMNGCDSTTILHLIVHEQTSTPISATICQGGRYQANGFDLFPQEAGVFLDTLHLQTTFGCDSTVTLALTVNPVHDLHYNDEVCANVSYTGHGFDTTFTEAGDYILIHQSTNAHGCDSTTSVALTVHPSYNTAFSQTACVSYTWDGTTYTESGDYTKHYSTASGCDSIVTLQLTIHPSFTHEFSATECVSYTWNDSTYYQSGDYIQHFETVHGCDSTVTLHLTIHPAVTHEFSASNCVNYVWNDSTYYQSGSYIQHFETIHGCDSTVTLHLTIFPAVTHEFTATECEHYTWNDSTYDQSGDYIQHFETAHGCDSIVTLHLTIHPALTNEFYATQCESYTWNDSTYYQSGDYVQHFETINGCDSTVTLHLTIHPAPTREFSDTACISYRWNDSTYTQSGDYMQHFETIHGCDSTVTLHLTIHTPSHVVISDETCAGEAFTLHGFDTTFKEAGTYTLTHEGTNANGCDSTTVVTLTVHPVMKTAISRTICFNESYLFNNRVLTDSGTYIDTLATVHGCDSIVTLVLTKWPEQRDTLEADICLGESYYDNGFAITNPTATAYHSIVSQDIHGCDSTTILLLNVHNPAVTSHTGVICQGERYIANGFNIYGATPGTINRTLHLETFFGCDSTVTLQLTVLPTHHIELTDAVCVGTPYQQYGFDTLFTQARRYTLTHNDNNQYGCDSVTTLQLTVMPVFRTDYSVEICHNDSYYFNGQYLTETDTYLSNLTAENGCDSIVTLHLTVRPEKKRTIEAHICKGDSYHQYGFDIETPQVNATYERIVPDIHGCDSTTYLQLYVHELDTTHLTATICEGEAYTLNGFDISPLTAGEYDYQRTESAAYGCEFTLMLHLTVNPTQHVTLADTICERSPYNRFGFDTLFAEAGNYTLTHESHNEYGCDSTTTLHLAVMPTSANEFTIKSCELYTWNDSTYTQSGDYVQHFINANGCDSTVTLHLTIQQALSSSFETTACESYTWNDSTYYESGDYIQHFNSVNGCDSTVTLHLTLHPTAETDFSATECESYTWNDSTYYESGDYVQHFNTVNGCDSTVTLHLTLYPTAETDFSAAQCESYTWNDSTYYESGDYIQHFNTANGCDSTVTLHLTLYPAYTTELTETSCDSLVWNDSTYHQTGVYTKHFNTVDGCDSTVVLHLTIRESYTADTSVNVCDADLPFVWNGTEYLDGEGVHEFRYSTADGCDSLVRLHLNVFPTFAGDTTVTVCQGALPYAFDDGHLFSQGGDHDIHLLTANGCDSIWHLHLTVTPNSEHTASATICDNQLPYAFMDSLFYEAGQYDIVETDNDNCLIITHFTLNVNPTYHGFDTVSVCQEDLPVLYGGTTLSESGDYDILFPSALSCDSLVSVHFEVTPTATGSVEMFVCAGDFPVVFGGQTFSQEGDYEVSFQRDGLCDSVVALHLHEAQKHLFSETLTACDHELPVLWRGRTLSQGGTYYDSLSSVHGCDSVFRLTLTVNETQLVVENPITLCDGESESWRGLTLAESGVYRDTVSSETTGCREIHEVTVTVHPTYLFHDTVTICSDELPYLWHGMALAEAGTREDYHQTAVSYCDSIYRLTLIVNPAHHVTENASACDYDLPFLWHGREISESGTYHDTLASADGCDSSFTLNFTVNPSEHTSQAVTVCDGELPYSWRGHLISAAGTYSDTVPNAFGCDNVYVLMLSVNLSSDLTIYDTICQGSPYSLNGFDTVAAQAGTLYDFLTLSNAHGCDSTVNLILTVLPNFLSETFAETCENVPFSWRGSEFVAEGTYFDSLTSSTGCDSVFVLHLAVNPTFDIYVSDTAMNGHEYVFGSFVTTPADSGLYLYDFQNYTIAGCDSIVHLTLYVEFNDGIDEHEATPAFSFFPNPTAAALNIQGERMRQVLVFNASGKLVLRADADSPETTRMDVAHLADGHYIVRVILDDGKSVSGKIIVRRH